MHVPLLANSNPEPQGEKFLGNWFPADLGGCCILVSPPWVVQSRAGQGSQETSPPQVLQSEPLALPPMTHSSSQRLLISLHAGLRQNSKRVRVETQLPKT